MTETSVRVSRMTKRSTMRNKTLVENAIKRDGKCMLCGTTEDLSVHHIIPIADGGTDTIDNMITLCDKHHYLYHHWPKNEVFGTRKLTMRGMDKKASDGYLQYRVPYGYIMQEGNLVIDKEAAENVERVFKSYIELRSTLKVARKIELNKTSVLRVLRNPVYCGCVKWNNKVYEGMHEPIIDRAMFDVVNKVLDENRKK